MEKPKVILVFGGLALLAIFVLIGFARLSFEQSIESTLAQYDQSSRQSVQRSLSDGTVVTPPPVLPTDPAVTPDNYSLTIIEYADFECPYCQQMAGVLAEVLFQREGIRYVWKDLVIPGHPQAKPAALAARCAQEQDKFWAYHDILFANQELLGPEFYTEAAKELSLDEERFSACIAANRYLPQINRGLDEANQYGIDGTPYLFIGSTRIDRLVTASELNDIIDIELQKK